MVYYVFDLTNPLYLEVQIGQKNTKHFSEQLREDFFRNAVYVRVRIHSKGSRRVREGELYTYV